MKLKIIFEDNHLLVVEKPINMPTQGDNTGDLDLLTFLKKDLKARYEKPGNVYLGLVHRLDRPVGGVMVFAKTSKAASRLSTQIREGNLEKNYLAVAHGLLKIKSGRLNNYLIKDCRRNIVTVAPDSTSNAKEARLDYEVIGEKEGMSLLEIALGTGRSHQIRVQFAAIGHPLYGDRKYGAQVNRAGEQLALFAFRLRLQHPVSKEYLEFKATPFMTYPWTVFPKLWDVYNPRGLSH